MLLNGKNVRLNAACTVAEFLKMQNLRAELVAIELNGSIVPRAEFNTAVLTDSDEVEVVSFVGGG